MRRKLAPTEYFDLHSCVYRWKPNEIALQLSGGKDSVLLLYLLEPHWQDITVYWLDTGDAPHDVYHLMAHFAAMLPRFEVIHSPARAAIERNGWPSDLVPVEWTVLGQEIGGPRAATIQDRYHCCFDTIMGPLHRRMKDDGVQLILRGQKKADKLKSPIESGAIDELTGAQLLFPLAGWTDEEVWQELVLRNLSLMVPDSYNYCESSVDCLHCTAYWSESRSSYLIERYPEVAEVVRSRARTMAMAFRETIDNMKRA